MYFSFGHSQNFNKKYDSIANSNILENRSTKVDKQRINAPFNGKIPEKILQKKYDSIIATKINDSLLFQKNIYKGLAFFKKFKDQDLFSKLLIKKNKTNKENIKLQRAYIYRGLYFNFRTYPDSSYYYINTARKNLLLQKKPIDLGYTYFQLSNMEEAQGNLVEAINLATKALNILDNTQDIYLIANTYNTLALSLIKLKEFDKGLEYLVKMDLLLTKNKEKYPFLEIINLYNFGWCYQKMENHKKAVSYFNKGLQIDSLYEKYPISYAFYLEGYTSSNYLLKKIKSPVKNYTDVIKIRLKNNDFKNVNNTYILLSNYYKEKGELLKAIVAAKNSLKISTERNFKPLRLNALITLSKISTPFKSNQYLNEYIQLSDSIYEKERAVKQQFALVKYETYKKEEENKNLKIENQNKEILLNKKTQQAYILLSISLFFLVLLSVGFGYTKYRKNKLLYLSQLEKAKARELERKNISKSLHDEVAGDLRVLYKKLKNSNQNEAAYQLNKIKESVRNLSHQLSSTNFNDVSFNNQLINLISDYFELDFKIKITGLDNFDWKKIEAIIKRTLYLCCRESIQNAKKHANASLMILSFSFDKKNLYLRITDNGKGFLNKENKEGIGLKNLKERVQELNGTFSIKSSLRSGTETNITVPRN